MGKKDKEKDSENIKVAVRVRPLFSKEADRGEKTCVECNIADNQVVVKGEAGNPYQWTFDYVFNPVFTQNDIFLQVVQPMIESMLEGFNSTIFAYGQSGSGKTHTMTGVLADEVQEGIVPRSFHYIFGKLRDAPATQTFRIFCSFLELYNGKCRDLLCENQVSLAIREAPDKSFFVQDLNLIEVKFEKELFHHMEEGTERRCVTATDLNAASSRSHSVFTVHLEQTDASEEGDCKVVTSKLNLVDLAGSERQTKTNASGDTLKEGANINLSLSALGTVIDSIVKGKGHIPFRSSPLTMLLKDSLGGGSKTVMFANIRPSDSDISETVSTLRFADRAKQIKNKPKVQMDPKDQKIAELIEQVDELKTRLKKYEGDGGGVDEEAEKEEEKLQERVAQLELDLEQANSEAQRVATEMEQSKASGGKKEEELTAKVAALEEQLLMGQQEKSLGEQKLADEQSQHHELQALVLDFINEMSNQDGELLKGQERLESGNYDVHQVSTLLESIKDRAKDGLGGVTKEALSGAVSQAVQEQKVKFEEAEKKRAEGHTAEIERLSALNEQAQSALNQSMNRLVKMKEKIEKEKSKQKDAQEAHKKALEDAQAKSDQEAGKLKGVIENLEQQLQKQQQLAMDLQRQVGAERVEGVRASLEGSLRLGASTKVRRPSSDVQPDTEAVEREEAQLEEEYHDVKAQYEKHEEELLARIQKLEAEKAQLGSQTLDGSAVKKESTEGDAEATEDTPAAPKEEGGADPPAAEGSGAAASPEEVQNKEAEVEKVKAELARLKGQFGKDKERLLGRIDGLKKEVASGKAPAPKRRAPAVVDEGAEDPPLQPHPPATKKTSKAQRPLEKSASESHSDGDTVREPEDGGSTPSSARRRPSQASATAEALPEAEDAEGGDEEPAEEETAADDAEGDAPKPAKPAKPANKAKAKAAPAAEAGSAAEGDDTSPAPADAPERGSSPSPLEDGVVDGGPTDETRQVPTPARRAKKANGEGGDGGAATGGVEDEDPMMVMQGVSEEEYEALRVDFERSRADCDNATLESQRLANELEHQQREYSWLQQKLEEAQNKADQQGKQYEREAREWTEEKQDLEQEIENARNDLMAEVQKSSAFNQEQIKLARKIEEGQQALQAEERAKDELKEVIEEMKRAREEEEERAKNHQSIEKQLQQKHATQVSRLEAKLQEKANVLENNRKVLQTQQELLEKKKEKEQDYERKLTEMRSEMEETEVRSQQLLTEQTDKMTKLNNRKIEEIVIRHRQQLQKEQKEKEKMNKKLMKEKTRVEKVKERYDQQMVLYREVEQQLEVMKEAEMRRVAGFDPVQAAKDDINKLLRPHTKELTDRQQALMGLKQKEPGGGGGGGQPWYEEEREDHHVRKKQRDTLASPTYEDDSPAPMGEPKKRKNRQKVRHGVTEEGRDPGPLRQRASRAQGAPLQPTGAAYHGGDYGGDFTYTGME